MDSSSFSSRWPSTRGVGAVEGTKDVEFTCSSCCCCGITFRGFRPLWGRCFGAARGFIFSSSSNVFPVTAAETKAGRGFSLSPCAWLWLLAGRFELEDLGRAELGRLELFDLAEEGRPEDETGRGAALKMPSPTSFTAMGHFLESMA